MTKLMQYKVVVIGGTLGLILISILIWSTIIPPMFEKPEQFSLVWRRTGGFAGVNDVFTVDSKGFATYTSRFSGSFNTTLSKEGVAQLKALIMDHGIPTIQPTEFHAKAGVADFFTYELKAIVDTTSLRIVWVDAWASDSTLPPQLIEFQEGLEAFIRELSGSKEVGEEEAGVIASNFIENTSTFKFDGLSTDFTVTRITRIVNEPPPYGYT